VLPGEPGLSARNTLEMIREKLPRNLIEGAVPVFRKDHASNKKIERDARFEESHPALKPEANISSVMPITVRSAGIPNVSRG